MILCLVVFLAAGSTVFLTLSAMFWAVCVVLGHNTFEMLYGATAVYLLTIAAAVEAAWLFPDEIRSSSWFTRLTQRFRSFWD